MIRMEVDCHSPSFMTLRTTTKRARSPGSPNERPNKRPSLTIDRLKLAQSSGNMTPQSSASSSRFPSEDWVQQTDGLTIDSPVIVDPETTMDRDGDMNMYSEDMMSVEPPVRYPQRPALPPIQTAHMDFAHASLFRRHYHQHTPTSATSSVPTPLGPLVTVLPPTPSISTSAPYIDTTPMQTQPSIQTQTPTPVPTRSSTPVDSAMVLSSPGGSFTATPTPRKQRFTMGPRADCMKCQMNVKGHSVHY